MKREINLLSLSAIVFNNGLPKNTKDYRIWRTFSDLQAQNDLLRSRKHFFCDNGKINILNINHNDIAICYTSKDAKTCYQCVKNKISKIQWLLFSLQLIYWPYPRLWHAFFCFFGSLSRFSKLRECWELHQKLCPSRMIASL